MENVRYELYRSPDERPNPWVRIPEAVPPVYARLRDDAPADLGHLTIRDGKLEYDDKTIQIEENPL